MTARKRKPPKESPTLELRMTARRAATTAQHWICLRCGGSASPAFRKVLVTFDHEGKEEPGSALCLCAFCNKTIRNCLEKGTRLVPIIQPPSGPFPYILDEDRR